MTKMKSSSSEKIRFERKEILVRVGFPLRNGFQFLAVIWERSPNLPEVPHPLSLYLPQKQKMTFLAVICKKTPNPINCGIISIMSSLLFARGQPHLPQKYLWRARRHLEENFWSFKHLLSGNAKFVISWEKKIAFGKTKVGEHKTEPISDCERTKMEKVLFVGGGGGGGQ